MNTCTRPGCNQPTLNPELCLNHLTEPPAQNTTGRSSGHVYELLSGARVEAAAKEIEWPESYACECVDDICTNPIAHRDEYRVEQITAALAAADAVDDRAAQEAEPGKFDWLMDDTPIGDLRAAVKSQTFKLASLREQLDEAFNGWEESEVLRDDLAAAVLALADDAIKDDYGPRVVHAVDLRALVTDPAALDRVRAEAAAVALREVAALVRAHGSDPCPDMTVASAYADAAGLIERCADVEATYRATEPTETVTGDYWHGPDRTEPTEEECRGTQPDWCTCPDDCDCDGVLVCGMRVEGTHHQCQMVPGHEGWHRQGGHRWGNLS